MSVITEEYFQVLLDKSSKYHGVAAYGQVIQPDHSKLLNRTSLLFALDCFLEIHRQTHATLWSSLSGKDALIHALVQKYKWPLSEITSLSLKDSILLLQEELNLNSLPPQVVQVIQSYGANRKQQFPDLKDEEWDPDLYLTIPKQQNW